MRQPLRSEERDDPQGRLTHTRGDAARRPVLVAILAVALVAAAFASLNPVTRSAKGYAAQIATASAGTYLTLRTLNAFLSTAQEVEVGASFVAQGSAQPLKWLEPVDDTVERVAQVVFVVMVVTGVLAVALVPASALGCSVLAGAAALALVARGPSGQRIARRLGGYGALIGVAVPLALLLSSVLANLMTAQAWAEHSATLTEITAQVEPALAPPSDGGVMGFINDARGEVDRYRAMASAVYDRSDDLVASLIALASIHVFKLLVLPLLLLGGLWVALRGWLAS